MQIMWSQTEAEKAESKVDVIKVNWGKSANKMLPYRVRKHNKHGHRENNNQKEKKDREMRHTASNVKICK